MLTTLDLAGWRVRLVCRPAALAAETAARYAPFVVGRAVAPHLTVEATLIGNSSFPTAPTALPRLEGGIWRLDAAGFSGTIDFARAQANLILDSATPQIQIEYFLRVLIALLAQRQDGLLIHAAGLRLRTTGQVYLFAGCSGAGKSTVMRLSADQALALNDDLVLARPGNDGWIAYGTPFWNVEAVERVAQTAHGPIAGVCVLIQDRAVYLEPCSLALAIAELAVNCPVVNGDPALMPELLARCRSLAQAVPVRRLHFRKAPDFWQLL